jgi:hypothetical protein
MTDILNDIESRFRLQHDETQRYQINHRIKEKNIIKVAGS